MTAALARAAGAPPVLSARNRHRPAAQVREAVKGGGPGDGPRRGERPGGRAEARVPPRPRALPAGLGRGSSTASPGPAGGEVQASPRRALRRGRYPPLPAPPTRGPAAAHLVASATF